MDDDIKIKAFLSASKTEVEDNGFSERVMRRISATRPVGLAVLEGVVLTLLAAGAFIYFDGWGLLCSRAVSLIEKIACIRYTGVNPLTIVALLALTVWYITDRIKNIA